MPRILLEKEGTATEIFSFLTNIEKVKFQALNKRSYYVILPRVIQQLRLFRIILSKTYGPIE